MDTHTITSNIVSSSNYKAGKWLHTYRQFKDQFAELRKNWSEIEAFDPLKLLYRQLLLEQTQVDIDSDPDTDGYTGETEYTPVIVNPYQVTKIDRPVTHWCLNRKFERVFSFESKIDRGIAVETWLHNMHEGHQTWNQYRDIERQHVLAKAEKWNEAFHGMNSGIGNLQYPLPPVQSVADYSLYRIEYGNLLLVQSVTPDEFTAEFRKAQTPTGNTDYEVEIEAEENLDNENAQAFSMYGQTDKDLPIYLQPELLQPDWEAIGHMTEQYALIHDMGLKRASTIYWEKNENGKSITDMTPSDEKLVVDGNPENIYALLKRAVSDIASDARRELKDFGKYMLEEIQLKSRIADLKTELRVTQSRGQSVKEVKKELDAAEAQLKTLQPGIEIFQRLSYYMLLSDLTDRTMYRSLHDDGAVSIRHLSDWYTMFSEELDNSTGLTKQSQEVSYDDLKLIDKMEKSWLDSMPEFVPDGVHPSNSRTYNRLFMDTIFGNHKDIGSAIKFATKMYYAERDEIKTVKIENGHLVFGTRFGTLDEKSVYNKIKYGLLKLTEDRKEKLLSFTSRMQYGQAWKKLLQGA